VGEPSDPLSQVWNPCFAMHADTVSNNVPGNMVWRSITISITANGIVSLSEDAGAKEKRARPRWSSPGTSMAHCSRGYSIGL
jgi:hypothetical protein